MSVGGQLRGLLDESVVRDLHDDGGDGAGRDALDDVRGGARQHLRAGPLDDDGWTILAANSAVASKLRHLLPTLAETLVAKGWQATSIRVKVQSTLAPGR